MSFCTVSANPSGRRWSQAATAAIALAALLPLARPTAAQARSTSYYAYPVYLQYVTLDYGEEFVAETDNLSFGADSVMHLFLELGDNHYQVAFNDDHDGLASRIEITNSLADGLTFLLLVRPYSNYTYGEADLVVSVDGATITDQEIPVDGYMTTWIAGYDGPGEVVHTVETPGGSEFPVLFGFDDWDLGYIDDVALDGGPGMGVTLDGDGMGPQHLLGTAHVMQEDGTYVTPRTGYCNVVINDADDDSDGDGLGDSLEAVIGTCATDAGCGYAGTYTSQDTDRDGLMDGEEVLGAAGDDPSGAEDLSLPRFGADPLHKDLFLEVDYMSDLGNNPFADKAAAGTLLDWVEDMIAPYEDGPASHLKNPDGVDGIAVHMDLGVAPADPADEILYGDYSTGAVRAVVEDFIVKVNEPITGTVNLMLNGNTYSFTATGLDEYTTAVYIAWILILGGEPVSFVSLDGDPGDPTTIRLESSVPGQHFTASIAVPSGEESKVTVIGEEAGSLRNHYHDADHVDPVRVGRMRYAVVTSLGSGGQASGRGFVTGINYYSFGHELGHTCGLAHYGHSDWGTGANCIPHYFSTMNYAYTYDPAVYKFSDTDDPLSINPADNLETGDFPAYFDTSYLADDPWYLDANATQVDWNRSGVYATGSSWQGPTNLAKGNSCGTFIQGLDKTFAEDLVVSGSVDIVRAGDWLYGFYVTTDGLIHYRVAELGSVANASCTGSDDPTVGDCLTWDQDYTLGTVTDAQGLSVAYFDDLLHVAYRSTSDYVRFNWANVGANGILSVVGSSSPYADTDADPELVVAYADPDANLGWTERLVMLRSDKSNGQFKQYHWGGVSWLYDGTLKDPSGVTLTGAGSPAATPWPDPYNPSVDESDRMTCALLPNADLGIRLFCLNNQTQRWEDLTADVFRNETGSCTADREVSESGVCVPISTGKPTLAFAPMRYASGQVSSASLAKGNFMIGYGATWDNKPARMMITSPISTSDPPTDGDLEIGEWEDWFYNVWAGLQDGSNLALYGDHEMGGLVGLSGRTDSDTDGKVEFYPHGDGTPYMEQTVYSDFRVMEDQLCRILVDGTFCGPRNVFD